MPKESETIQSERSQLDEDRALELISTNLAYRLVERMICVLGIIIVIVLLAPLLVALIWYIPNQSKDLIEYYKSNLTGLLGAFGAWIGAGAAYFFGKTSQRESSRSTEQALRIQQQGVRGRLQPQRIMDLRLTTMKADFMFTLDTKVKDVLDALEAHIGYWFVPVMYSSSQYTLHDVIHARVFWDKNIEDESKNKAKENEGLTISDLIAMLDGNRKFGKFKKFHGESFFMMVSQDDRPADVLARMAERSVEVGIVVDAKQRPTHCFSQTELRAALNLQA